MNKKLAGFIGVFAVVVVVIAVAWGLDRVSGHSDATTNAMKATANGFPVPQAATVAFPDNTVKNPPSVTKGWNVPDKINDACTAWRDAYRSWIGTQNLGSVTGNYTQGQECDYTGPKDGFHATLQVAVYGNNPQPQVTLTVTS